MVDEEKHILRMRVTFNQLGTLAAASKNKKVGTPAHNDEPDATKTLQN